MLTKIHFEETAISASSHKSKLIVLKTPSQKKRGSFIRKYTVHFRMEIVYFSCVNVCVNDVAKLLLLSPKNFITAAFQALKKKEGHHQWLKPSSDYINSFTLLPCSRARRTSRYRYYLHHQRFHAMLLTCEAIVFFSTVRKFDSHHRHKDAQFLLHQFLPCNRLCQWRKCAKRYGHCHH